MDMTLVYGVCSLVAAAGAFTLLLVAIYRHDRGF